MARRPPSPGAQASFSLFPFLSVLACVIGTLTLLISAIALGQVADGLVRSQALDQRTEEQRAQSSQIEALHEQLANHEAQLDQLAELRKRASALSHQRSAAAAAASRTQAQREKERSLAGRLAELREVDSDLGTALEGIAVELDDLESPPEAERIQIQPLGNSQGLVPFFAECSIDGVRLRRADGEWNLPLIIDDILDGPKFSIFLNRVASISRGTVIFLIRPDGIPTYRRAVGLADKLAVRHGKLALAGDGELDFSLF